MSDGASIVMLAGRGDSTNIVYHALAKEFRISKVVLEDAVPRSTFLRRRVRRLGLPTVVGQVLFQAGMVPFLRRASRERLSQIKRGARLNDAEIPERVIARVTSVNARESAALLRELQPRVVVVNGTRILTKALLNATSARFLNTHAGITPLYRGVHGGYWALAKRDIASCGVTVHLVDEGVDTGSILGQAHIHPTEHDNFVTYPYLQLAAALPLLVESVGRLLNGEVLPIPPPRGESRLWSHPTIAQYVWHRVWHGVR